MSTSLLGRDAANLLLLHADARFARKECAPSHLLLRQSHCLEGIGGVAEPLEADGPTVAKGPNVRVLVLSLRTAAAAARGVGGEHDDPVADIFDLTHIDPNVLERLVDRAQGVFVGGDSSTCPRLDCAGWIYVLDVGMQQAQGGRRTAAPHA